MAELRRINYADNLLHSSPDLRHVLANGKHLTVVQLFISAGDPTLVLPALAQIPCPLRFGINIPEVFLKLYHHY